VLTLYDAARCPYAARVRIVLAEKGLPYDSVEIDLADRPAWLYRKNPAGRVPVLEDDGGLLLAESRVIVEYLDERFPEPALMPGDPAGRALVRLALERFDRLADPYYDVLWRRAPDGDARLESALARLGESLEEQPYLAGATYTLADVAYVPWILRAESRLGVDVRAHPGVAAWLARVEERPAVAQEVALLGVVGSRAA
jgi:glutathione S-transferase